MGELKGLPEGTESESFWLEKTLQIIGSNHKLTLAQSHVPDSLNYGPFKHLQGR